MRRAAAWGFVSQGASSVKNLALVVLAARSLGPEGLGVVTIGFSLYVVAFGLQRALILDPLTILSSGLPLQDRRHASRRALTLTLLGSLSLSVAMLLVGALFSGVLASAVTLFGIWMLPALAQDFFRTILFRDDRAAAASLCDIAWLTGMGVFVPAAWLVDTDWAVVSSWGAGACMGAALGVVLTTLEPTSLASARRWWRQDTWPVGRWLAVEVVIYNGDVQAKTLAIAAFLGPASVGGWGAVLTIFAPLSLIVPAISLPGLPAVTRAAAHSAFTARMVAAKLGCTASALALVYVALIGVLGQDALSHVFGSAFAEYSFLILPVGIQQILGAIAVGFILLLKAMRKTRQLVLIRAVVAIPSLLTTILFSHLGSLALVAWSTAAWTGIWVLLIAWSALSTTDVEESGRRF